MSESLIAVHGYRFSYRLLSVPQRLSRPLASWERRALPFLNQAYYEAHGEWGQWAMGNLCPVTPLKVGTEQQNCETRTKLHLRGALGFLASGPLFQQIVSRLPRLAATDALPVPTEPPSDLQCPRWPCKACPARRNRREILAWSPGLGIGSYALSSKLRRIPQLGTLLGRTMSIQWPVSCRYESRTAVRIFQQTAPRSYSIGSTNAFGSTPCQASC